jgi:hypothetical protein
MASQKNNQQQETTMIPAVTTKTINGIDTEAPRGAIETVTQDASCGMTRWHVVSHCDAGRARTRL